MKFKDSKSEERRAEARRPADGDVTLRLRGVPVISGHLLDIAKSGFRAQHRSPALRPGDIVEYELAGVNGRARVVWTRILGEHVESGLLFLAADKE